jgi:hypothetical protein
VKDVQQSFTGTMGRFLRALFVTGLLAAATNCRDATVTTGTYATLDDVRQAGALERGWIPSILPPGAHDIREAHDTGSRRRWGVFSFRPEDDGSLRGVLQHGEISIAGARSDIPGRIEWWPIVLRDAIDQERISATGLKAHRSLRGDLIVVVNWAQRRAYYWADGTGES